MALATTGERPEEMGMSDTAACLIPILVLEESLVELAGWMAGEFFTEIDRAWALDIRDLALAKLDEFAGQ